MSTPKPQGVRLLVPRSKQSNLQSADISSGAPCPPCCTFLRHRAWLFDPTATCFDGGSAEAETMMEAPIPQTVPPTPRARSP